MKLLLYMYAGNRPSLAIITELYDTWLTNKISVYSINIVYIQHVVLVNLHFMLRRSQTGIPNMCIGLTISGAKPYSKKSVNLSSSFIFHKTP